MAVSSTPTWPLQEHELLPALRVITTLAHAEMGVMMLLDSTTQLLMPVIAYGLTHSQCEQFGSQRFGDGAVGVALAEHRLVRVRNVWRHRDAWAQRARELGFRHAEILPFFRASGEPLGVFAVLYRRRAGSPRGSAQLATECANLFAMALAHADEHVQAEQARAQIARTAKGKVQFVARMSHELRTPLQSIAGYVNLLQTGRGTSLSADQARMLDRIAVSERILVHLIDDLIAFSRLEAGDITYRFRAVSAATAIQITEGVVSPLALEQQIELQLDPAAPEAVVFADEEKLQQVLVNLVANAIKYSPPGAKVTLRCRDDADSVLFDVVDDGPGIPPEKLGAIFEPYVRLDSASASGTSGWGLGLAICRELAAGMHGSLTVRSAPGRGSAFTLRLPRDSDAVSRGAATDVAVPLAMAKEESRVRTMSLDGTRPHITSNDGARPRSTSVQQ